LGVIYIILKKKQQERFYNNASKKVFYRALKSGLQSNMICNLSDVENIYKGTIGEGLEGTNYQKFLNIWLREFNLDIISKNQILTKDDTDLTFEITQDNLIKWKNLINTFILELDEKSPYTELDDAERYMLNDISLSINLPDQKTLINPKLLELASLIKSKSDQLVWEKTINKITIITTIIGIILTIIFGMLSLSK